MSIPKVAEYVLRFQLRWARNKEKMNLTKREKQIISTGAVLLCLLVAFHIFVRPAIGRVRTLRRVISEKRQVLSELLAKSQEYNTVSIELEKIRSEMKRQPEERKILSFIEGIQKECGLMQKVVYMKPSANAVNDVYEETTIEIKFQNLTWDELTQFLFKIESSELTLGIKNLNIKRGVRDSSLLDTIMQLVSISPITQD